jgi:hypothetical protein
LSRLLSRLLHLLSRLPRRPQSRLPRWPRKAIGLHKIEDVAALAIVTPEHLHL